VGLSARAGELGEAPDAVALRAKQLGEKLAEEDIQARLAAAQRSKGPWVFVEFASLAEVTPLDKAARAVADLLTPSKDLCISYIATSDSEGNPLRGGREYEIIGRELDARWWSMTAYDPEHLIANERAKYSISKTAVTANEDGEWIARITSEPRDGDAWVYSGDSTADLALVLRLYGPSEDIIDDLAAVDLPDIRPDHSQVLVEEGDEADE
jgi:hypothetical protein